EKQWSTARLPGLAFRSITPPSVGFPSMLGTPVRSRTFRRTVSGFGYSLLAVLFLVVAVSLGIGPHQPGAGLLPLIVVCVLTGVLRFVDCAKVEGDTISQPGGRRCRPEDASAIDYRLATPIGARSFVAFAFLVTDTSGTKILAIHRFGYPKRARRLLF